jgi:thiamine kinase-like enzyme
VTPAALLELLRATGLVRDHQAVATSGGTRNANHVVENAGARLFVKTANPDSPESAATLANEAAFYAAAAAGPLAAHLPRLVAWVPAHAVLCLEHVARPAARLLESPAALSALADVLAVLHRAPRPRGLARRLPAGLSFDRLGPDLFARVSAANVELLAALHQSHRAVRALAGARRRWRVAACIHGDLKLAHVLGAPDRLVLVDWELAGPGDPAWDVAAVLHEPLREWAESATRDAQDEPQPTRALDELARHVPAFWRRYREAAAPGGDFAARVRVLVGARLVQSAVEANTLRHRPSYASALVLQVGLNVLEREDALATLLGIA